MFGRVPTFSNEVAQFDAKLDQLSWNDAVAIGHLTLMAKTATVTDVDIIVACVLFRIITVRISIFV